MKIYKIMKKNVKRKKQREGGRMNWGSEFGGLVF
jgi:hypothetical protein